MNENETRDVAVLDQKYELSVSDVKTQVAKIQELMRAVMKKDEHYGVIPGTQKPTLLKSGSEKLGFIFRLTPKYDIKRTDLDNGHREYEVVCSLYHIGSGAFVGQGVGSCSTMESKYRYRNVADYEVLDQPIPDDARQKKQEYRKQGLGMKKIDGTWRWVRYGDAERRENPDIADVYNTVLKMAKKRAHVDAMLTACAASDIFTQDAEDFSPAFSGNAGEKKAEQQKKSQPTKQQTSQPPRGAKNQDNNYSTENGTGPENLMQQLAGIVDNIEYFSMPESIKAKQKMHKAGTLEERQKVLDEYEDLLKAKKGDSSVAAPEEPDQAELY